MEQRQELLARINQTGRKLSKGQKRIAEFIVNHYDKAAFMTASRLGEKVQVSESTVVRFAIRISIGYPALQKALQEMIRNRLTAVQRVEMTGDMSESAVLGMVFKADHAEHPPDHRGHRRNRLHPRDRRAGRGPARLRRGRALLGAAGGVFGAITWALSGTTSASSPPASATCSSRSPAWGSRTRCWAFRSRAIRAGRSRPWRFAKDRGARVLSITDTPLSPLGEVSDLCLTARSDMASFVDSLVAPLSLINALIVALSLRKRDSVSKHFAQLESLWEKNRVYVGKEKHEARGHRRRRPGGHDGGHRRRGGPGPRSCSWRGTRSSAKSSTSRARAAAT